MTNLLRQFQIRWGVDSIILGIFATAFVLYGIAWWIRQSTLRFNITVFELAGGILILNVALTGLAARREVTIGYLLAGAALFVQILLLIVLWKATQGTFT